MKPITSFWLGLFFARFALKKRPLLADFIFWALNNLGSNSLNNFGSNFSQN